MQLNSTLLDDIELNDMYDRIDPSSQTRGSYNHIFYVLRLHPEVHQILSRVESGENTEDLIEGEISQAMSTLFHENLHWWQYIGSTSGLIMSLSLPAQISSSLKYFKQYLELSGKKKPIDIYSDNNPRDNITNNPEFMAINYILNNFHDVLYYKYRVKRPRYIKEACKEKYFESIGHAFHISYASSIGLLATTFDRGFSFLPNPDTWTESFDDLTKRKVEDFYYGSKIVLPQIGTEDLFEGQARFNQILFLHLKSKKTLDWIQFEQAGMLHGVYYSAFKLFLELLDEKRPASVESPLVALFLLLIDIAINPAEGFPFTIEHYEDFVKDTDPGIRFIFLCQAVKEKHPEFKGLIKEYSSEEYWKISNSLCEFLCIHSPYDYLNELTDWCGKHESIIELLKQNEAFIYENENLVVRLIFGRFLSFQKDKINNPEFFCWPGVYINGERKSKITDELYLKHQAIFKENINMDIAPSMLPGIEEKTLKDTAGLFYGGVTVYELCQQWILEPGEFKYNLQWLSNTYSREDMEDWLKNNFIDVFGVSPDDFEIINPVQSS
ncbi:TPA: hypothetical protein N5L31_000724 [Enterobacter bugandensis]|uniref:hypothetical protein n=1 Tax=Enterobacter bugandensis TaxID=881260 RepID=UPI0020035614|nr:hypothetical protein [Enterobacter bugandensis]MCK7115200.1 hypothetical protein [Enterobacter bugandensis]MCK7446082.1 hypothetical protein [Enterobacter bugandensis]HCM9243462.1 hypothetical protein [Enterobacter bugandensis]